MENHAILFMAANPSGSAPLALDREARAIQDELDRSRHRDRFELVTRWAAEPIDLLRELRRLRPTVMHFSGHGARHAPGPPCQGRWKRGTWRDISGATDMPGGALQPGLVLQDPEGRARVVSTAALHHTLRAAGSSVQLVVLNACYSDVVADVLSAHVPFIVGMRGSIQDDAARSFAIGFYGGLGDGASLASAFEQGCAAISVDGLHDADRPQLRARAGVSTGWRVA